MRKQWVVGFCVLSMIGCVAGMDSGNDKSAGEPQVAPTSAPSARQKLAGGFTVDQLRAGIKSGARTFNATSYRVSGPADTEDVRVQMAYVAANTQLTTQKADWNVTTNAPVRTTATTYGASWVTSSNTDMLAFAVDSKNVPTTGNSARSPGITGGANGCTGTTCKKGTLYVLTDLYSSTPTVLYYNNASSNESYALNGLFFNFSSTPRLYSLDQTGHLFCNNAPLWTGSSPPTSATNMGNANCTGYGGSGTLGGVSSSNAGVTWSGPYPMFNADGTVERTFWCTDKGYCTCVYGAGATGGTAGSTCTGWPKQVGSSTSKMGPPAVYGIDYKHYVLFVGDESGTLYRAYDNAGTIGTSSVLLCGSGTCASSYQVHSAAVIDYTNNLVYVAAGGKLFSVSAASTGSFGITSSVSLPDSNGWSNPIDAWPTLDGNGYIYVTADNTLFKAAVGASGLTGTVYSASLNNQTTTSVKFDNSVTIAAQSQPLGYPLVYYSSVFVNTGKGGASGTSASGAIEQYGCETSAAAPVLTQKTTGGPYGTLATTGEVLDFATGNLNFGYENGVVSTSDDGTGGIVQYNANGSPPTTNWACPSPYTGSSTAACGSYGCSLGSGTCVSHSNCSAPTARCNTSTNKCVACLVDSDCGAGSVCASHGTNPSYTCVTGAFCTSNANCSTQSTKTKCELSSSSPYYETCQQCTTGDTSNCTGSTAVCASSTSDKNYDSCVQCDVNDSSQCTGTTPVCDTTSTSSTFDKCIGCSPANDTATAGNMCSTTAPICTTSGTCVQCDLANQSVCPVVCAADNYCYCTADTDCPSGTGCNTTTHRCTN